MSNKITNLDEGVQETFEFILGGHTYKMRYPNTEEILEVDKIADDKKMDWMYGFISSDDEQAPPISEALGKKNIKVLQRFNDMIIAEFGVNET